MKGSNRTELLESVKEPNSDPDMDEAKETVEAAIWKAMDDVAGTSQASITGRVGVFVRMEAIRTEQHQTRYQPLLSRMR